MTRLPLLLASLASVAAAYYLGRRVGARRMADALIECCREEQELQEIEAYNEQLAHVLPQDGRYH